MRLPLALVLLLSHSFVLGVRPTRRFYNTHDYYVLEHDPHAGASLEDCARALGVEVVEQAGELVNHWLVRIPKHMQRRDGVDVVLSSLTSLRSLASEGPSLSARSTSNLYARELSSSIRWLDRQELRQRVKRAPPPIQPDTDSPNSVKAVAERLDIHDPSFPQQWHLINTKHPEHSMNVTGLWDMGFTGEDVISALVDDGLAYEHPDLAANFWAKGSHDFNDHEDLPTPKLFDDHHGTRCAGQIGAVKNDACGVGIAWDSKIAGIRILSGPITDVDEAASLNFGFQETSIFSCSWGPPDDGKSMEAPGYLIEKAIVNGVTNGRGGKGSVFVYASGNGASHDDQCNFDGYTNSIYSVTVAAVDHHGLHPYYSEACAANLVVAYSSGGGQNIVTTDIHDKCSSGHGGTSAAAPNAAGVFALALGVRPELTWRDIQHIAVRTSRVVNPGDPDWDRTAAGRPFSYKYGYGVLDGYTYVMEAQEWELVKPQAWIHLPAIQLSEGAMNANLEMSGGEPIGPGGVSSKISVTADTLKEHNFETLEHVTVRVWIEHSKRGDVSVELVSPNGIKSMLAAPRSGDTADTGFPGWRFMSVKHWDESPIGDWTIRVFDNEDPGHKGKFLGWTMSLWGSVIDPANAKEYIVPQIEHTLPPDHDAENPDSSVTTKVHPKPTDHLPGDHDQAEGEATKPAFSQPTKTPESATSTSTSMTPTSTGTMVPTVDEGLTSQLSNLFGERGWIFGAGAVVLLFGVGVGIFFWRRAARRRQDYTSLPGDEVAMSSIRQGPAGRTRELYDAFGEGSEDEDDADERTGLRGGHDTRDGLGFHAGFLDDDDPQSAGTPYNGAAPYKDNPTDQSRRGRSSPGTDESWEHASQTR